MSWHLPFFDVIDQLEGNDATRVQRIERELGEVKELLKTAVEGVM